MDRFESMSIFVALAEYESLSAASRKLKIPLATVSRKLSELETHLGVSLLIRSTRGLELTETGKTYLVSCKRILEDIVQIEKSASGEFITPKGDLVITAPMVFGRLHVLPLVSKFLKSYPDINIQLILNDRSLNMLEEHIDIAFRVGELPDSSMVAVKLASIRKITCASPGYLAARSNPKIPLELKNHDCISNLAVDALNNWSYHSEKKKIQTNIKPRLSVNTSESALDAAISGLGITRALSYQAASALREGRLKLILEKFDPPSMPVHMLHSSSVLPLKVQTFKEFVVPLLKDELK